MGEVEGVVFLIQACDLPGLQYVRFCGFAISLVNSLFRRSKYAQLLRPIYLPTRRLDSIFFTQLLPVLRVPVYVAIQGSTAVTNEQTAIIPGRSSQRRR